MGRGLRLAMVSTLLCSALSSASAETIGLNLRMTVALRCTVQHMPTGGGGPADHMVNLGELREFCNAPQGYELVVSYAPGTLRGARLSAGSDQIILNGSGEAVLSREAGPRIVSRPILAAPGENGFDTDRLMFQLRPA